MPYWEPIVRENDEDFDVYRELLMQALDPYRYAVTDDMVRAYKKLYIETVGPIETNPKHEDWYYELY
jgi:hypothetical protein